MAIKILLVDDNKIVIEGIRSLLSSEKELTVVGEANDGLEAIELVLTLKPDMVIMDISMPNMNGIDATREILSINPKIKVIALSVHSEWAYVADMIESGASGYLLKDHLFDGLIKAIKAVLKNEIYVSEEVSGRDAKLIWEALNKKQEKADQSYENV
jgi:two-component system, NarL family, response regulator NreC